VFPQAIGLAATFGYPRSSTTWPRATALEDGPSTAGPSRRASRGPSSRNHLLLPPTSTSSRDPPLGRGQETYGEDPFLTGRMGVAFITGLQGDDPTYLTAIATAKHYAVHKRVPSPSATASTRSCRKHDLEDTYLPAFRDAVGERQGPGRDVPSTTPSTACRGARTRTCSRRALPERGLGALLRLSPRHRRLRRRGTTSTPDTSFVKSDAEAAAVASRPARTTTAGGVRPPGPGTRVPEVPRRREAGPAARGGARRSDQAHDQDAASPWACSIPRAGPTGRRPPETSSTPRRTGLPRRPGSHGNDGAAGERRRPCPWPPEVKKIAVVGPLADSTRVLLANYNGTPSRRHGPRSTASGSVSRTSAVVFEPGTRFLRPPQLVPPRRSAPDDGAPGLKAEVFATLELAGAPVETRVDPELAFGCRRAPGRAGPSRHRRRGPSAGPDGSPQTCPALHARHRGLRQPALPRRDAARRHDGPRLPFKPHVADVSVEKGRRYALKVETIRASSARRVSSGCPRSHRLDRAVAAARAADVVVAVVGITSDLEGEESGVDQRAQGGRTARAWTCPAGAGARRGRRGDGKAARRGPDEWQRTRRELGPGATRRPSCRPGTRARKAHRDRGDARRREQPAGRLPVTFYKGVEQLPDFTTTR